MHHAAKQGWTACWCGSGAEEHETEPAKHAIHREIKKEKHRCHHLAARHHTTVTVPSSSSSSASSAHNEPSISAFPNVSFRLTTEVSAAGAKAAAEAKRVARTAATFMVMDVIVPELGRVCVCLRSWDRCDARRQNTGRSFRHPLDSPSTKREYRM